MTEAQAWFEDPALPRVTFVLTDEGLAVQLPYAVGDPPLATLVPIGGTYRFGTPAHQYEVLLKVDDHKTDTWANWEVHTHPLITRLHRWYHKFQGLLPP